MVGGGGELVAWFGGGWRRAGGLVWLGALAWRLSLARRGAALRTVSPGAVPSEAYEDRHQRAVVVTRVRIEFANEVRFHRRPVDLRPT